MFGVGAHVAASEGSEVFVQRREHCSAGQLYLIGLSVRSRTCYVLALLRKPCPQVACLPPARKSEISSHPDSKADRFNGMKVGVVHTVRRLTRQPGRVVVINGA